MSEYYTKAEVDVLLEQTRNQAVEDALKSLPFVVKNLVAMTAKLQETSENFYKDNADLVEHKPLVAAVLEHVEATNPGATLEQVVQKTAIETRKRLKDPTLSHDNLGKPEQSEMNQGLSNLLDEFGDD